MSTTTNGNTPWSLRRLPSVSEKQITELAEKAADPALTPDERAPLYRQIWDLTLKEAMFVPICNQTNASVSNGKVTGLDDMPWVDLGIFDVRHVGMVG